MIEALLLENARLTEQALEACTTFENDASFHTVVDAMRYSLLQGGKRIRPTMLLEFFALCGGEKERALPFAAALECIHTYSLIHDDLPCMDDDDLRRGKPSCHRAFDEATALLAGDGLLTLAFETAANAPDLPPQRVVSALSLLARRAGVVGMIGGQVIDLQSEGKDISLERVTEMYARKTGALLCAAAEIGCLLAGATPEQLAAARQYAEAVGLAFQIVDDLLDAEGDTATLGKPVGSDEKNEKSTYVRLVGVPAAKRTVGELTANAKAALAAFSGDTQPLAALADFLSGRRA